MRYETLIDTFAAYLIYTLHVFNQRTVKAEP